MYWCEIMKMYETAAECLLVKLFKSVAPGRAAGALNSYSVFKNPGGWMILCWGKTEM